MAYTEWNPEWATGHELIDDQHKQLIAAVNSLFDAQKSGKGRNEVERTMNFLVEYTTKHFNEEQKLQEESEYPLYPEHKQIHNDFKNTANELFNTLHRDGPSDELISHICVTMGRWVINHIKSEDFKLVAHIKSREQEA